MKKSIPTTTVHPAPSPVTGIAVEQFVSHFNRNKDDRKALRPAAGGEDWTRIISEPTVNRPGLLLAAFTRYFAPKRVQVIGNLELAYLGTLEASTRAERCDLLFAQNIPCVVFSRDHKPKPEFLEVARRHNTPVFMSAMETRDFINLSTIALDELFAPKSKEMGSMVDVMGVGVILKGESGIGKSECVLGLIERGYALVADDITEVKLLDQSRVIGTSPELMRNLMEVRGIGIINIEEMFGVRHIRHEKQVDLVVTLMPWEKMKDIERVGMDDHYTSILGVDIPHVILPVRPGRDVARLVEVAAMHLDLRRLGRNPAKVLNDRLIQQMALKKA